MSRPTPSFWARSLLFGSRPAQSITRIIWAFVALLVVTAYGTGGYMLLGLDFVTSLYTTVFTVATVGFGETYKLTNPSMLFTTSLIVLGCGVVLYNLGVILEAVTEGRLREYLGRRRMERDITKLRGHVIVCGYGRVGRAATQRLLDVEQSVVVVDKDVDRLTEPELLHVVGDASRDEILRTAGIEHARALICALDTDADTTYATLSARALRPDLVIISRARTGESKEKLVLAGATRAVNPQRIGGRRMASFALHADVAEFLDEVMHDDELEHTIEGLRIPDRSPYVGRTVGEIDVVAVSGAQLLAVRRPRRGEFIPTPPSDLRLDAGCTLILFGNPDQVRRLAAAVTP